MAEVSANGRSNGVGGLGKNPPDEEDLRQFFGRNDTYYFSQYQKISAGGGAFLGGLISWNWSAFLLSVTLCLKHYFIEERDCLAA